MIQNYTNGVVGSSRAINGNQVFSKTMKHQSIVGEDYNFLTRGKNVNNQMRTRSVLSGKSNLYYFLTQFRIKCAKFIS